MARAFRRRNYLIKKKFQLNFMAKFVVILMAGAAAIAGLFMYVSSNTITTGYSDSTLKVASTPSFFLASFLLITVIVAIVMGIAGIVMFIFLSHRIAGPLYRFENVLKGISEGDLTTRINLRKTDQLNELKEALNALLDSLDRRMGRAKNALADMHDLLSEKVDQDTVLKLRKKAELLKDELGRFKVSPPKE